MSRAVALVLVGLWAGLLLASWAMASASFRAAERLSSGHGGEAATRLAPIPEADRRQVLRSLAAEWNRSLFRVRSLVEIALGGAILALAWPTGRAWGLAALGLTLAQALVLGPAIARLGRSLDFAARPLAPDVGRHFGLLHGGYVLLDLGKIVLVLVLAAVLSRRSPTVG